MIKHCKEYCTTPETRTTTFSGFPAGWIPRRIEVKWRATSAFAMYSNSAHGEVRAKIEYSLDGGGSWDILGDEFISTDTAVMPNMTEQYYGEDVSGAADSDQVQVRATLTVRMSRPQLHDVYFACRRADLCLRYPSSSATTGARRGASRARGTRDSSHVPGEGRSNRAGIWLDVYGGQCRVDHAGEQ